jgi:plasmid stabilization system protein ParE
VKLVRFHDEAKVELAREALYYNGFSRALAERFIKAVEDAVALASEFPEMGAKYKYGTRRCYPKRFPFLSFTLIAGTRSTCSPSRRSRGSQVTGEPAATRLGRSC